MEGKNNGLIEMELFRIQIDENRGDQVIVLKEKHGMRTLPIVIGIVEATAIKMKISGFSPPRPLTHDLLNNTIIKLDAHLERIVVEKLEDNIFYAKLVIRDYSGNLKEVDARPSDSIALALRANAPIFVRNEVLEKLKSI
ncbi:MAG: bifunctional nuclease family protein [Candidatus Omnitrophica bacterium]|nr:bifunctional nuclease family protein [Candidatus Omnitrophota bacterium]MCM8798213.1 bifunctional nuclease family protein [Candidatus Omnitrophota bacterium]